MSIKVLNEISHVIQDEDIFYVAYGKLTQSILQSIVATARNGIYDNKAQQVYSNTEIDSLIAVSIEMVQNVSKYREEIEYYNSDLVLITINDGITISTSNLANEESKEKISKNIDFLNSLDKKELRKYARETMKKTRNEDSNSAGLGLIEIARLSKDGIKYNFNKYIKNDNLFHFNMTVNL